MGRSVERVKEAREKVVAEALELMEGGRLDWASELFGSFSPRNYSSGHVYKGGNRIHLGAAMRAAGWTDPRFLTFRQATEEGLKVRKGEKGSIIERWKMVRMKDADGGEDEGADVSARPVLVGYWIVFNIEQCEGEAEPFEKPDQHDGGLAALSDSILAASPCPVRIAAAECPSYSPGLDRIEIYPREQARSVNGWTRSLLHEMAHATGHPSRLDRDIVNLFGTPDYAREELVAELAAAFAAAECGLPAATETDGGESLHMQSHAAYLQSWIGALKDDPGELFRAATKASAAADYLMERIDPASARSAA